MEKTNQTQSTVPAWVIVIAWLWAGLPLAWGVLQTVHKASALFQ